MPTQGEGEELTSLPVAEAFPDEIVEESTEVYTYAIVGMTTAIGLEGLSLFRKTRAERIFDILDEA